MSSFVLINLGSAQGGPQKKVRGSKQVLRKRRIMDGSMEGWMLVDKASDSSPVIIITIS